MGVEVNRVLRDGFYDEDKVIIQWVKKTYNLDYMGAGINSAIRTLVFKLPEDIKEDQLKEWGEKFDEQIKKAFLKETFV